MRIYFFAAGKKEHQLRRYQQITAYLKQLGGEVFTNLEDPEKYAQRFEREELEEIDKKGRALLEFMDGLVIEGSIPSQEIGYLLAFAISQGKPILYLLEQGAILNKELQSLSHDKKITKNLKIKYYTIISLEKDLADFVERISGGRELKELPSLKFTLRITPSLEKYLDWKSKKKKQTKADYLRNLLNEIKRGDREYRK